LLAEPAVSSRAFCASVASPRILIASVAVLPGSLVEDFDDGHYCLLVLVKPRSRMRVRRDGDFDD
jgi:hypothetical protein